MSVEVKTFLSKKYGDRYRFRFQKEGATWGVYVESHPSNPWGGGAHDTHILAGNRLCLTEQPQSMERAVALCLTWINYYSQYIRTGSTIQQKVRAHINDGD